MLTLVVAVGLVALAAVLKSMAGKHTTETQAPPVADNATEPVSAPAAAPKPVSTNNAAITEQLRTAEIEKQLDEIRGLVVEGAGNPTATSLLLDKVTHAEPAVRTAALEGVLALNDSNAIPRLQEAEQILENPREKVAVMDAIAYLQLPETMPDTPATNDLPGMDFSRQPVKRNPADPAQKKRGSRSARRLQAPPAAGQPRIAVPPPQAQPATPDAAAPPPQ